MALFLSCFFIDLGLLRIVVIEDHHLLVHAEEISAGTSTSEKYEVN